MIHLQDDNFDFIEIKEDELLENVKNKFVIALDFDGVISNPYALKTQYINELGYNIREEECSRESCLSLGVKKEHYDKGSIRAYTENPPVLSLEKEVDKGLKIIKELDDILTFIVTSRYDNMLSHLEKFLKFYKIKVDGVINTQNKSKTDYLTKLNANIFVDDDPRKILELLSEDLKIECKLILYKNIQNMERISSVLLNKDYARITLADGWNNLSDLILLEHDNFIKYRKEFN